MFHKGQHIIVYFAHGRNRMEWDADFINLRPLTVKLRTGDASVINQMSDGDDAPLVDLRDVYVGETLITAKVLDIKNTNTLELRPLGTNESREFVRVSAQLEMSIEPVDTNTPISIDDLAEPSGVQPLPEMNRVERQRLARTEEASQAVLYLIEAVQALDAKLDFVQETLSQLVDQTRANPLLRRPVTISGSGLRFLHDEDFKPGSRFVVRIRLPMGRAGMATVVTEVVRTEPMYTDAGKPPRFGIACKFVQIRDTDRERIVSFAIAKQREALKRMSKAVEDY